MPAVRGAFGRITVAFAQPRRRWQTGSVEFPDGLGCLFVGVFFDLPSMRRNGDEVSLLSVVIAHFKEPDAIRFSRLGRGIDYPCLDCCFDLQASFSCELRANQDWD